MMAIMTCAECGADLREWDFLKRRARLVENRPYCTVCKPQLRMPRRTTASERFPVRGARQLPRNRHCSKSSTRIHGLAGQLNGLPRPVPRPLRSGPPRNSRLGVK
jgi:hypothetical protein